MKILVLGGDGYLGWPTALHLSEVGHKVAVADNFARRIDSDQVTVSEKQGSHAAIRHFDKYIA